MPTKNADNATRGKRGAKAAKTVDPQWSAGSMLMGLSRRLPAMVAWFLLVISGYFLSYQLFFIDVPVTQIANKVTGKAERKAFPAFQGAPAYGYKLQPGQTLEFDISTPWIAILGRPSVALFVETGPGKAAIDKTAPGQLRISGLSHGPEVRILTSERLQRFTVPWTHMLGQRNPSVTIQYQSGKTPADGGRPPPIILSASVVGFSVWLYVGAFAIAALALLLYAPAPQQQGFFWDWERNRWRLALVAIAVLLFLVHSGGFTSRELFEHHHRIGSACKNLGTLLSTGHLKPTFYRSSGIMSVPLLAFLVEFNFIRLTNSFCNIYPTTAYIFYALWVAGLLFIVDTLRAIWNAGMAVVFAIVTGLYFPFLIDVFKPDADAFLIVLFAFYLGLVLRLLYESGARAWNIAGIVLVTFLMGMIKVNAIFLTLLLPATLLLKDWNTGRLRSLVHFAAGFAVLLAAFQAGKTVSDQFQHPERHVGVEGQQFQRHVFWHMVWAAYGKYDRNTAHDFVKDGKIRNARVAERTGLPNKGLLRQSETATRDVYKPDVLNALSERPGFFFSTGMYRFHRQGVRFFRYNRLGARLNQTLVRHGLPESEGPGIWKVVPLYAIGLLTQPYTVRITDTLLLALAIIGIFVFKSVALRFFLLMTAFAQLGFAFAFHDVERYFMFCSWALLLGLSAFIYSALSILKRKFDVGDRRTG